MSISKSDLKKTYRGLTTNELLDMYQNREHYTSLAVEMMVEELRSRELTDADKEAYLHHIVLTKDEMFQRQNFNSLMFLEKVIFYYLALVILAFAFFITILVSESKSNGNTLKIRQAKLYVITSICILFISLWINENYGIYIWAPGFLIPFYYDHLASARRDRMYRDIYKNNNNSI